MDELKRTPAVDAASAAGQAATYETVLAAIAAERSRPASPACHHQAPAPRQSSNAAKWLAAGVGGSVFLVAFALSAVAVAVSAVALTICVLVLRDVWNDFRKGR